MNYLGDVVLVVYKDNGETGYQAHRESLYKILNPDTLQVIASASLNYVITADGIEVDSCTVNDASCSYNDYMNIVDSLQPIISTESIANDKTDGSMGLHELLYYVQASTEKATEQQTSPTVK